MRVVIADDSRLIRERLTAALLEIDGVAILGQSANAMLAVDSARLLSPDVVVMDIMFKGEVGLDALRAIKRCRPTPIVVVFTNYSAAEYEEKGRAAGANFYFAKSTEFKAMMQTLKVLAVGGPPANFGIVSRGTHSARSEIVESVRRQGPF